MNVREGMRRLGILLGACGGILGGCLAYSDARATWDNHTAYRKFASLMASPTVQKVAEAARDDADSRIRETTSQTTSHAYHSKFGGIPVEQAPAKRDQFGGIPVEDDPFAKYQKPLNPAETTDPFYAKYREPLGTAVQTVPDYSDLGSQPTGWVAVNLDGIKTAAVDKAGLVSSIELSTGELVQRVDPPALKAYLIPLLYPVLGFLLPWGGIRVLTWVGSGFVAPRQ